MVLLGHGIGHKRLAFRICAARIIEAIANHDDAPIDHLDTDIDWGHVGDIVETRKTLQETPTTPNTLTCEGDTSGG